MKNLVLDAAISRKNVKIKNIVLAGNLKILPAFPVPFLAARFRFITFLTSYL